MTRRGASSLPRSVRPSSFEGICARDRTSGREDRSLLSEMHCGFSRRPPRRTALAGRLVSSLRSLVLVFGISGGGRRRTPAGRPASLYARAGPPARGEDCEQEPARTARRRNADPMSFMFFIGILIAVVLVPTAVGTAEGAPTRVASARCSGTCWSSEQVRWAEGLPRSSRGSGRRVSLYDAAPGAVERGSRRCAESRLAEKGGPDPDEVLEPRGAGRGRSSRAELMIEAVVEDADGEGGRLPPSRRVLPAEAVLASNTSSIPISTLAAATGRPDRVIGMHFFNPVR